MILEHRCERDKDQREPAVMEYPYTGNAYVETVKDMLRIKYCPFCGKNLLEGMRNGK